MGVSDPTMALGRATLGQSSTPVYLPGPVDIRGVDRCKRLSLKSIRPTRDLTYLTGNWISLVEKVGGNSVYNPGFEFYVGRRAKG